MRSRAQQTRTRRHGDRDGRAAAFFARRVSPLLFSPLARAMAFVPIKDGEFTSTIYGMVSRRRLCATTSGGHSDSQPALRRRNARSSVRAAKAAECESDGKAEFSALILPTIAESREPLAARVCILSNSRLFDGRRNV